MIWDLRKHVFRVCDQVKLNPVWTTTETRYYTETLHVARLAIIILFIVLKTKALSVQVQYSKD